MGTVRADDPQLTHATSSAVRQPRRLAFGRGPLPGRLGARAAHRPARGGAGRAWPPRACSRCCSRAGRRSRPRSSSEDLVDKLLVFVAPTIAGDGAVPARQLSAAVRPEPFPGPCGRRGRAPQRLCPRALSTRVIAAASLRRMFTGLVREVGTVASRSRTAGCGRVAARCGDRRLGRDRRRLPDGRRRRPAHARLRRRARDARPDDARPARGRATRVNRRAGAARGRAARRPLRAGPRGRRRPRALGRARGRRARGSGSTRPQDVLRYCVEKGSVTVDGVSLTIAGLDDDGFAVALVPHTLAVTTLGVARARGRGQSRGRRARQVRGAARPGYDLSMATTAEPRTFASIEEALEDIRNGQVRGRRRRPRPRERGRPDDRRRSSRRPRRSTSWPRTRAA